MNEWMNEWIFIHNVYAYICVFIAAMLCVNVFMCAYLGSIFIFKQVLSKFIFALWPSSFLLQFNCT
jgi:hypothetical protein